jgi:oligoribonuclease NrnB/cAMP/cGMP phosphodiesterase (DHH superfamily)
MSDATSSTGGVGTERAYDERFDDAVFDALRDSVTAGTAFVEQWATLLEESDGDRFTELMAGYARAYDVWMSAAERQFELFADLVNGEEVAVEEFRDVWLDAANDAFKQLSSTDAFAVALGESAETFRLQEFLDETTQSTLRQYGFATERDVREVGERLVELERRHHAIERKLDRLVEEFER